MSTERWRLNAVVGTDLCHNYLRRERRELHADAWRGDWDGDVASGATVVVDRDGSFDVVVVAAEIVVEAKMPRYLPT